MNIKLIIKMVREQLEKDLQTALPRVEKRYDYTRNNITNKPVPIKTKEVDLREMTVGNYASFRSNGTPHLNSNYGFVAMPLLEYYESTEMYCCNLFHELIHWTGLKLDRSFGRPSTILRAEEERIAETGAAILCAIFDVAYQSFSAEYIQYYTTDLKKHTAPRSLDYIFEKAEQAVNYLLDNKIIERGE